MTAVSRLNDLRRVLIELLEGGIRVVHDLLFLLHLRKTKEGSGSATFPTREIWEWKKRT